MDDSLISFILSTVVQRRV